MRSHRQRLITEAAKAWALGPLQRQCGTRRWLLLDDKPAPRAFRNPLRVPGTRDDAVGRRQVKRPCKKAPSTMRVFRLAAALSARASLKQRKVDPTLRIYIPPETSVAGYGYQYHPEEEEEEQQHHTLV